MFPWLTRCMHDVQYLVLCVNGYCNIEAVIKSYNMKALLWDRVIRLHFVKTVGGLKHYVQLI